VLSIALPLSLLAITWTGGCSSRDETATSADQRYCDFAQRLDQQASVPTAGQIAQLKRLAPDEIRPEVIALVEKHDAATEARLTRWEKTHCR
jgi:hypothetical protein